MNHDKGLSEVKNLLRKPDGLDSQTSRVFDWSTWGAKLQMLSPSTCLAADTGIPRCQDFSV